MEKMHNRHGPGSCRCRGGQIRGFIRPRLLLQLLKKQAYGYELVQVLEDQELATPDPSTLFRALNQFEEEGLVSEESNVYTELSAWENLMFTARLYRVPVRERISRERELLESFGLGVFVLYFLCVYELILLVVEGSLMLLKNARRLGNKIGLLTVLPFSFIQIPFLSQEAASFLQLFFSFLKIGSVLYGGSYVLLVFLKSDMVERLGWLTSQQLIDAVAVGQLTLGPIFTTATFVGYLLFDLPGGLAATVGVFLPSFILVAISNPIIPQLWDSPWTGGLLDGINAASLGSMTAMALELGQAALVDPFTVVLVLLSGVLIFCWLLNSAWLVLGGALLSIFIRIL